MEITKSAIFELKPLETTEIYQVQEFIASIVLGQCFLILFLRSLLSSNKQKEGIYQRLYIEKSLAQSMLFFTAFVYT